MPKKQTILKILQGTFWCIIGAGTIFMLVAAIQKKEAQQCSGIEINIEGVSNNFFVDKKDILQTITEICDGETAGRPVSAFDLRAMEKALQKNIWVKNAQLYFDNNERLQVNVLEREPLARIFSTSGTTFYIDSSRAILPLSDKFSARLPVFTNFPSDKKVLIKADSNLLRDILTISMALQKDAFHMGMIEQVDITAHRTFEMIPKFGNTVIIFGDANNVAEKFDKLRLFYKTVVVKAGWNKYSEINVQYSNQVVAKRKGAEEVKADSLRTLQLMQVIADNAERMAADTLQTIKQDNEHNTTNKSIIQQSIERDDNNTTANTNEEPQPQGVTHVEKPAVGNPAPVTISKPMPATINKPAIVIKKPVVTKPSNTIVKPVLKPKQAETKKPKAVMPKPLPKAPVKPANEY